MDKLYPSEQLEEGEIVDDDVFEDISDNSIIEPTFGKLASTNENLRALSLSSGSEKEICKNAKLKRKLLHRKTRIKLQRKRKKRRLSVESSDTDTQCEDLKGKLKEAIHISGIENNRKNTLEARLKAMGDLGNNTAPAVEPVVPPPSPSPPPPPPSTDNDILDNSDKIDDNEIENLRIEALRTAVLNKFKRRKRKKTEIQNVELKVVEAQENKENTPKIEATVEPISNNNNDKMQANNVIDMEEDEDVLRASLLAGLAKKITKIQLPTKIITKPKPQPSKLPPVLPKKTLNNLKTISNKIIPNRPKPQVKPLIINLNGDSDSDAEDIQQKPLQAVPKISDLKKIATNVEKFLKEQRVKFETESKKRLHVVKKNDNKSILEKSAVKLLPKSQQIEYQQLLRKLKNAERQKLAKKIAQLKEPDPKEQIIKLTIEVPVKEPSENEQLTPDLPLPQDEIKIDSANEAPISDFNTEHDSKESEAEMKKYGVMNELTILQKSLKEIKLQRNGSLQIKSKYQVLTPIIRKITAASNTRKKHELRIKNLSKELNDARANLAKSHQRFSALVRELVDKKETIDKSFEAINTTDITKKQNGNKVMITETVTINTHLYNKKETIVPVTSTPIKAHLDKCCVEEAAISNIVTSTTVNCYEEDMDVCNSDETDIYQIDIVDPNDIDQIFKRRPVVMSTMPEYVSPLNLNSYERYRHVDPLGIMCPYEVNGSCRDLDCSFKHYLKNHNRL